MDATQIKRIRKVAIAHFVLTILVCLLIVYLVPASRGGRFHSEQDIKQQIWSDFGVTIVKMLQPLPFLVFAAINKFNWNGSYMAVAILVSIPLWSICFGWIFVKLDNWMNHFPVLGRKVF